MLRHELQKHYEWHDDMEFRHQRDEFKKRKIEPVGEDRPSSISNAMKGPNDTLESEVRRLMAMPGVERVRFSEPPKSKHISAKFSIIKLTGRKSTSQGKTVISWGLVL
jgi:hypothetical protein